MDLQDLQQRYEELLAARYSGALTVRAGEQWVTYRSDAELRAALQDLQQRIEQLQGRRRMQRCRAWCAKGL